MKAMLQLRQSQKLTLTPQLRQAISLLQLSTQGVEQEVARLLDENPLLECEDVFAVTSGALGGATSISLPGGAETVGTLPQQHASEEIKEDNWGADYFPVEGSLDDESGFRAEASTSGPSLREHLILQLGVGHYSPRDCKIIGLLIDALDDNGYLAQPLEEIVEMLPEQLEVTLNDLETALVQLQHLDAPGIAARSLSECLALQLKALPEETPGRDVALCLVTQHLKLLAAHDFVKLKKHLRCSDDVFRTAQSLIAHLQPRPGAEFEQRVANYVTPEVIVERRHGSWHARLNKSATPRLQINQLYANILQRSTKENASQLASKLQEARWFIQSLQQRSDTILRVSQAIVHHQTDFLERGESAMRPLVLQEIASQLDLHESTISRATTQKFMLTPRGIYEFKYFFCSGVTTTDGDVRSSMAIRTLIGQAIKQEPAHHPLTDERMSEMLAQQGIVIARRTVAKYRELLKIPPANLRKLL
ncbi:MAG: RNA polymerase factor sigma-54 [Candidatus Nitrotoga sp.]|nr:RNA polymerase factor sigma-54 [Candidatus Nitrotoga sp.]MBP0118248.1 RNA polymerase factor sigma-54 [Candidatus Nitrotoga sp.]